MGYKVELSNKAIKSLAKIDKKPAKIILNWITKNLEKTTEPRAQGKPLTGDKKGYWRYRVGTYRVIADIKDNIIKIEIVNVRHRKDVYEKG